MISLSDTIDADSLLHDDVLCFDHHAAGQRTILVSHLHIVSMVTAFHQLNTENVETEVEIIHPFLACRLVPLHKDASHNKLTPVVRLNTDRAGAQSIELKIHEDRAWNVLSRACFGEESVERIVPSINGHPASARPAAFLVRDPSNCRRCRLRIRSVSLRKFCVSNVDSLSLHLPTGPGVPIPGCLFTGSWVPIPCCFLHGSWVPLPGCFPFFSSSFNCSLSPQTRPRGCAPSSLVLTDTVSSRGLCHLLTLCSLASLTWKRSRSFNESVHFSSCSRYNCDLPPSRPSFQLQLSALFDLPLPVAFSSDHHISLQSRQQCPDLPQFQHLTLLMWFWPLYLLPFPFLEPSLSVVTRV